MKKLYMVAGLLVLLLAIAVAAVACGDTETTTTTAPVSTETTTAPSTDTSAAVSTDSTAPSTQTTAAGPTTGEPIKIGLSNSLTGVLAAPGKSMQQGVQVQIEYINANGGINGRPLELVEYDDKSEAANVVANLTKLIQDDKVAATIGPFGQAFQETARQLAEQNEVPMVGNGPATLKELTADAKKYTWSVYVPQSPPAQAAALVNIIKNNGWKNVLAIGDVLPIDQETLALVAEAATAEGFTFTLMPDTIMLDQVDFQPILNKLMDQYQQLKPDAIVIATTMLGVPPLYKGMRGLGITIPVQASSAAAHPALFMMGPEAVEGLLVMDPGGLMNPQALPDTWPIKTQQLDFLQRYQAKFNAPVDFTAATAADLVTVLAEAMKKAGGPDDKEKVRESLMSLTDIPLICGVLTLTPDDNTQGIKDFMVEWQIKGGQWEFVSTLE